MLLRQVVAVLGSAVVDSAQLIHRRRQLIYIGLAVLSIASHLVAIRIVFRQVKAFELG